ncbi:hypothetical protein Bhyg_14484 [Pseudolycoriella hygida]|uniref:Uncharacterized protein n=1 Tax=Pseudolycoriella hygida TaxID=35572 RepID=A0A9Q0MQ06_9DIPT|nr:hypothetical protein Bhyg_14484 [Pseudolycoriella hygida]
MKTKRKSENLCSTVCDVILCFLMLSVLLNAVDGGMPNDNQKILSRRRRYLTFPEGSSFQVVYEIYQPIPNYGTLLIFYLTQAMAWELPSKAYHPEEHLQEIWDDIVFPNEEYDDILVNDNQVANAAANNLQNSIQEKNNVDRNNNFKSQNVIPNEQLQSQNQQGFGQQQNLNQQGGELQNRNGGPYNETGSKYYYPNNVGSSAPNYYSNYPQKVPNIMEPLRKTITNKMDHYLSYADKVINQITDFAKEKHNPWRKTDWSSYTQSVPPANYYAQRQADRRQYAFEQSRHFIHPAFGKRSTDKNFTPEETFNMNYHRSSRQKMYQKIAKFLSNDKVSGAECVLKALCETGKRRDTDKKPGPFLMEILRVVFSLPEAIDKESHPVYSQYDNAHTASEDCDDLFPKCESSLWNKNVILQ